MSLVLYNPLEAGILLLATWFFKPKNIIRERFSFKKFIFKCYVLGWVYYIIQFISINLETSIFYGFYIVLQSILFMPLFLKVLGYKNNLIYILSIVFIFNLSLDSIIYIFNFPTLSQIIQSNLIFEFCANLIIRTIQLLIIILCLGVENMIKNFLKNQTKKKLGKEIAETFHGYGEPKLATKLAKEVKESK